MTGSRHHRPAAIRPARPEDYDAIVHVWRESGLKVAATGRESKASFDRQLAAFGELYLVATDEERVVGVVLGTHDVRKGWINRLAVLPTHRRRGIAAALVRRCDQRLRSMGIEIVSALVEPPNEASCAVFEKLGYRTDVEVVYFRKPSRPDV